VKNTAQRISRLRTLHKGYEDKELCIKDMRIKNIAQTMRVKNDAHRITGEEHFKTNKG
jgi:hypothetical protein